MTTINDGYSYRHEVGPTAAKLSTLSFLASHFSHSSESEWLGRIEAGEVLLDDRIATGTERLCIGQIVIWNRPGWAELDTPQHYEIAYQDKHLLAVAKPSGLPTIPGAGFYRNTLLNLVQKDFPQARPLHRLGRATSGLVLFAFDRQTAAAITLRWPNIQKQYQALGSLIASEDVYDIRCPIGPWDHPRLGKIHAANESGKPARSVARVLQRRSSSTIFEVDLHTGRPHQIRIHLAHIGHPLVGDPLYAVGGQPIPSNPGLPGDAGYWLHAKRLTFPHPFSCESVDINASLPAILNVD